MIVPSNPEQEAAKLAQLLRKAADEMQTPAYRERLRFFAEDAFARYKSFIAAGFTEAQALALVIGKV